jgi:PhoH-like ATPase
MKAHAEYHPFIQGKFLMDKADHRIINIAYVTSLENPDKEVVLITKDCNMRVKSKALGIWAEDYTSDQIKSENILNNVQIHEDITDEETAELFYDNSEVTLNIKKNSFLAAYDEISGEELLVYKDAQKRRHIVVNRRKVASIYPKNREQVLATHILMDSDIPLVCITGPAGTGKTILALAAAIEQRSKYWNILLTRPIVPLSGKDIGALPGDVDEKIRPYMQPLFDNLGVIKELYEDKKAADMISSMLEKNKIIIEPLTYIRGRSLQKKFLIVDEGQNLTPHEVKTIVTRAGKGTKIIFTGDIHQIDNRFLDAKSNGLSYLIDRMSGCDMFCHIDLIKGERSKLAEIAGKML